MPAWASPAWAVSPTLPISSAGWACPPGGCPCAGAMKSRSPKPYEEYYLDDELLSAMLSYQNPYEFVEPILEIISTNPSVNFGMPGDLVHFVEKFYKKGYEELLINSVRKNPTSHNILMLHRCYNNIKNPNRNEFAKVVKTLKNDKSVSSEIKNIIDEYDWD